MSDRSFVATTADAMLAVTLSGVIAFNPLIAAWIAAAVVVSLIVSKASALTINTFAVLDAAREPSPKMFTP